MAIFLGKSPWGGRITGGRNPYDTGLEPLALRTPPVARVSALLDIECALCHVTAVQFDRKMCPYKSAILDFLQQLPFAFVQNVLGRANFALINPLF